MSLLRFFILLLVAAGGLYAGTIFEDTPGISLALLTFIISFGVAFTGDHS